MPTSDENLRAAEFKRMVETLLKAHETTAVAKPTAGLRFWVLSLAAMNLFTGGCALAYLWSWFVTPLGAPPFGVLHGVGLMLVAMVVIWRADTARLNLSAYDRYMLDSAGSIVGIFVRATLLGLGAALHYLGGG